MTTIIYDKNNADSTLAAAVLSRVMELEVCERSEFPKTDTRYVWIGVVPTKTSFLGMTMEGAEKADHYVFVNDNNTKHADVFPKVNYVFGNENFTSNSIGKKSLTERVLTFLNINPEPYEGLLWLLRNFNDPLCEMEVVLAMCFNMKLAKESLETGTKDYQFVPFTEDKRDEMQREFMRLMILTRKAIKYRSVTTMMTIENRPRKVFTFYEPEYWWFIQRNLWSQESIPRNIVVTITGTVVTCSYALVEDVKALKPVVISPTRASF